MSKYENMTKKELIEILEKQGLVASTNDKLVQEMDILKKRVKDQAALDSVFNDKEKAEKELVELRKKLELFSEYEAVKKENEMLKQVVQAKQLHVNNALAAFGSLIKGLQGITDLSIDSLTLLESYNPQRGV